MQVKDMLDSDSTAACTLWGHRRSNRIANQQHQQILQLQSDHEEEPPKEQTPRQKQRRRKQGRPLISVSAASASNVGASNNAPIAPCLTNAAAVMSANDTRQSLLLHMLICFDCRYATLSLTAYTEHMSSRHDLMPAQVKIYCCPHCRFLASEYNILTEHLTLAAHGGSAVSDASGAARGLAERSEALATPLLASDATAADANAEALPSTVPHSTGLRHPCDSCGKRFRLRYQLTRHRHQHHQQQQQQLPSSGFDDVAKQLKPAATRKRKDSTGAAATSRLSLKLACRLCCKLFKSSRSYQLHRLAFHASESSAPSATDAAASTTASCVLDSVGARVGSDCLIVSDPEPFKCLYCDLKFAKKTAFAKHLARDHPAERPYQCDQCGRGFKFPHSLAMHQRFHLGELTCGQCGKLFHSDREFREHMASVHEGSLTFLCESCGRTFPTQYRLNRHSRSHNRARQLACPECGRLFHRADKLKLHLDCVHSDLRPHLCHLCGRAYNRRDKLALHIKQHQRQPGDGAGGRRRQRRPQQPVAVALDAAPPAQQLPMPPQPPHSPLGDALISIANGCLEVMPDALQQQQQPQDIFFESFDHSQLQQQQQQQQQQQLNLYSPVNGAFFGANDGNLLQ